ncbi:hypothetical protein [Caballeronia sp. NCTM5]|uniref:hypothetical protein n=1 Tax=Caballeronia sp. NCTM5 TaxID=2921755 RepID=UPI002027B21B|nr:hypothetical protein [Caballeronia sp. NCTM5]
MSEIANKRALLESANALVKTNQPTIEHLSAVADALARVASDLIGAECTALLRVRRGAVEAAIERMGSAA